MDRATLRHLMAAIIVADELKVPNIRAGDSVLNDERLHKQFTGMIDNTYCVVDLMLDVGDRRAGLQQEPPQPAQPPQPPQPPQPGGPLY